MLALKLRKEGDFKGFERRWLICGMLFIIISIVYIIGIEILMRYYYQEFFGLGFSFLLFHVGLQDYDPKLRELEILK